MLIFIEKNQRKRSINTFNSPRKTVWFLFLLKARRRTIKFCNNIWFCNCISLFYEGVIVDKVRLSIMVCCPVGNFRKRGGSIRLHVCKIRPKSRCFLYSPVKLRKSERKHLIKQQLFYQMYFFWQLPNPGAIFHNEEL